MSVRHQIGFVVWDETIRQVHRTNGRNTGACTTFRSDSKAQQEVNAYNKQWPTVGWDDKPSHSLVVKPVFVEDTLDG